MPIDLACYERDRLKLSARYRFAPGDPYFTELSKQWSEGVRTVFRQLPDVPMGTSEGPAR
jgi:putative proteasome-type protease